MATETRQILVRHIPAVTTDALAAAHHRGRSVRRCAILRNWRMPAVSDKDHFELQQCSNYVDQMAKSIFKY